MCHIQVANGWLLNLEALSVVPSGILRREDDQKLKWLAYFEFTQNQDMGEMTWGKVWLLSRNCCCVISKEVSCDR